MFGLAPIGRRSSAAKFGFARARSVFLLELALGPDRARKRAWPIGARRVGLILPMGRANGAWGIRAFAPGARLNGEEAEERGSAPKARARRRPERAPSLAGRLGRRDWAWQSAALFAWVGWGWFILGERNVTRDGG